ncbi:Serine threonine- phosphatase 6 regulatory ankyrin repeat subunit B [Fusarium acutatum]|uniref:Serine threonine- phosphatase 6 regulatory ankyrin repeat subunit B n=1 Tax=Fusarium acutatum TaxID=78861 RepID=A0A8H4JWX9_9HYPO|nr:Serine threonine- phosphatase 6 regulatory ankyrin repeat subunit B [Fusarium acutatum]
MSEFEGDDFSNNLFSDLAPLLTLFGEQVTKQFLSMSMGWADNILLAMGPLGVITIVIVRLIGDSEELKTLIVTKDGKVYDIQTAFNHGLLSVSCQDYRLTPEELESLSNAAPNLALNVPKATTAPYELWIWTALGVLLQLFALVFPALATFLWGWEKGIMLCGHVIEGVTEEFEFEVSKDNAGNDAKIFCYQRGRTVGEQHFPSCAIFNSKSSIKISRIGYNTKGYVLLTYCSSLLAVTGYIVQFVGFRALHWSATVVQLGITLVITGIRAWVRRGLAGEPKLISSPPTSEGHELAWLTLLLVGNDKDDDDTPDRQTSGRVLELISSAIHAVSPNIPSGLSLKPYIPICNRLETTLQIEKTGHLNTNLASNHQVLGAFNMMKAQFPAAMVHEEISTVSNNLRNLIEKTMDSLSEPGTVAWKNLNILPGQSEEDDQSVSGGIIPISLTWSFNVVSGRFSPDSLTDVLTERLEFHLTSRAKTRRDLISPDMPPHWILADADYLEAVLSICLYSMLSPNPHIWQNRSSHIPWRVIGRSTATAADEMISQFKRWLKHPAVQAKLVVLDRQDEYPNDTYRQGWRPRGHSLCLGMFLSSLSKIPQNFFIGELITRDARDPDTFPDADSTISQPVTDSLASLRSSILQHQIENGRIYHSMSVGSKSRFDK